MMKKTLTLMILAILPLALMAEENSQERIEAGSREVSHEEKMAIYAKHLEEKESREAKKSDPQEFGKKGATVVLKKSQLENLKGSKSFFSCSAAIHPWCYHSPVEISYTGDMITLEDGSMWHVRNADTYKILNWLPADVIVVTPNNSWFSSFAFRMTNQNTGESASVNMHLGPFYTSPYRHFIIAIDYYNNLVYLEDGSLWNLSSWDNGIIGSEIFPKWLVGDTVFVGVNDGWESCSKTNILINVSTLTWVRAQGY